MNAAPDTAQREVGDLLLEQGKLSEQQMQDVVVYIKSLWSDPVYQLWAKMEQQSLEP